LDREGLMNAMIPPKNVNETQQGDGRRKTVRFELAPSSLLLIALFAAGSWALLRLVPVLLVLVAALIIVGTVNPAVQRLEARRMRRGAAIALVFSALFALLVLFVTLTIPSLLVQAADLLEQEPVLRTRLANFLDGFRPAAPLADSLRNIHYDAMAKSLAAGALALSTRLIEVFAYSASAIFLALYLMFDRDRLRGWLFAMVPRRHHLRLSRVMMNLESIVGGYMRGQVITSALMAVFLFILLKAFSVPNALAIAVFGGAADVLPYIGALLTLVPAVLSALSQGTTVALAVFALLFAYEEFESRVLVPRIYGRTLRLPAAAVFFALLAGGTLYGIVGAFLSLPVAAAVLMLIEELRVVLPGEPKELWSATHREKDDVSEEEYKRRTDGLPAEQAAAIAIEISRAHQKNKKSTLPPRDMKNRD
jgi:predicted PurR-regulated permease PerM